MTVLLALALPTNILSVVAPALAVWPAKLLSLVMAALFGMTHLPGLAAWLSYRAPEPPVWLAWGFCVAFITAAWGLRWARRAALPALAAAAVFVVLVAFEPFAPRLPKGGLELTVLDCGQGDAIFVVLPDQTTLLLDAGGARSRGAGEASSGSRRWDPGEEIVSPYLWSRGIKRIDVVALSHAHQDHLGGLSAIIDNFRVGEFWHAPSAETPQYAALLTKVANRGIPIRTLQAGDLISRGDASIQVLWPEPGRLLPRHPDNDDSLVMRVSVAGAGFLLPGDAGRDVEKQLMATGEPLASQVLKVAHHGSKSSSSLEFIARVAPRVAIITTDSGALGNSPNPETLAVLRSAGAKILRTDTDGASTVAWKDQTLTVRSYRPQSDFR
jgi:competence protein ComEC